ncbi:MAG: hypothetical protein V4581_07245 [Bacteroidota bacterium]
MNKTDVIIIPSCPTIDNGRDSTEAQNPEIAADVVNAAMDNGGYAKMGTAFENLILSDANISVEIASTYDSESLKLIETVTRDDTSTTGSERKKENTKSNEVGAKAGVEKGGASAETSGSTSRGQTNTKTGTNNSSRVDSNITAYKYQGRVSVTTTVNVDGKIVTNHYQMQSEIISPVKLK